MCLISTCCLNVYFVPDFLFQSNASFLNLCANDNWGDCSSWLIETYSSSLYVYVIFGFAA
jgi:hypothetical protein